VDSFQTRDRTGASTPASTYDDTASEAGCIPGKDCQSDMSTTLSAVAAAAKYRSLRRSSLIEGRDGARTPVAAASAAANGTTRLVVPLAKAAQAVHPVSEHCPCATCVRAKSRSMVLKIGEVALCSDRLSTALADKSWWSTVTGEEFWARKVEEPSEEQVEVEADACPVDEPETSQAAVVPDGEEGGLVMVQKKGKAKKMKESLFSFGLAPMGQAAVRRSRA